MHLDPNRPQVGVAVVVFHEGKILLGKRRGGHRAGLWSCPGGHLEFGEEVLSCAARELKEETGLTALAIERGPWIDDGIQEGKHYISLFQIVREFSGEPLLMEPDKCEGWHWFPLDILPSPLFSTVDSFLKMFRHDLVKVAEN